MKIIHEEVELPDRDRQPLVHPLDLPPARRAFLASRWLSQLTNPTIFFVTAVALWMITDSYVIPILVPILIAACGALSSRYQAGEAWAHIPRKRQDHQRPLPAFWSVLRVAISAVALLTGLLLSIGWMAARDFPAAVGAYTVGMGAGIVIIMAASLLWNQVAQGRFRTEAGSRAAQIVNLVVVIVALGYGYIVLSAESDTQAWRTADLVTGAVIMIAIQLVWSAIRLIPRPTEPAGQT